MSDLVLKYPKLHICQTVLNKNQETLLNSIPLTEFHRRKKGFKYLNEN